MIHFFFFFFYIKSCPLYRQVEAQLGQPALQGKLYPPSDSSWMSGPERGKRWRKGVTPEMEQPSSPTRALRAAVTGPDSSF